MTTYYVFPYCIDKIYTIKKKKLPIGTHFEKL